MNHTIETLIKSIAPNADPTFIKMSSAVNVGGIMSKYGLTGAAEQTQLLAHMAVESGGFRTFAENMNYTAERLTQVWPKRFPTLDAAQPYARNPKALAVNVYGSRMGNRPGTTDGWDMRGSGGLQHTGRSEFDRVQKRTGFPVLDRPEELRNKNNAALIWHAACSYFSDRGALAPARTGDTRATTLKINGGLNGLDDRYIYVDRTNKVMKGVPLLPSGAPLPDIIPPVPTPVTGTATKPTTTEVEQDAKNKRNKAVTGAAGGTAIGGAASTTGEVPQTNTHWAVAAGVMIAIALIGGFIAYRFWRRHEEARGVVEAQQLIAIKQKVEP